MAAMAKIEDGQEVEQMLDREEHVQDPVDFGFIGHRIVSNTVCALLCICACHALLFDAVC